MIGIVGFLAMALISESQAFNSFFVIHSTSYAFKRVSALSRPLNHHHGSKIMVLERSRSHGRTSRLWMVRDNMDFKVASTQAFPKFKSKYVGASWDRTNKKWMANIRIDQKSVYLGSYTSEEDAARAFDARAAPIGRPVNFPGAGQTLAIKRGAHGIISRYKGVSWHSQVNKWQAHIYLEGKKTHLLVHDCEETAARAYDEHACSVGLPLNFPLEAGQERATKHGLSKFEGVEWNFDKELWEAVCVRHGKRFHLGFFKNETEAANAVDDFYVDRGLPRRHFPEEAEMRQANVVPASKYVGVHRKVKSKRWYAVITIDGKIKLLGYFDSEEEAARAFDEQATTLGRPVNFPIKGQKKAIKKGTSEYRGVVRAGRKWKAAINIDGKMKHLGSFETEEDAARKYDKAAAPLGRAVNFLF
jgi:hypothetical protein